MGEVDVDKLQDELRELTDQLFEEGMLDDQFTQLQQLQDENNPEFVGEVVGLFFEDSEKLLDQLTDLLKEDPPNYKKVDAHVHQFKGSSSSVGACRVKAACITFRTCCDAEDYKGCKESLEKVKKEFSAVKEKLQTMLKLEEDIVAAGGILPFS